MGNASTVGPSTWKRGLAVIAIDSDRRDLGRGRF